MRLPVEVVKRTREAVGSNFIIIYRLSMIDLIPNGSTFDEVIQLAKAVEEAGATIINTGIGWHNPHSHDCDLRPTRGVFLDNQETDGSGKHTNHYIQPH